VTKCACHSLLLATLSAFTSVATSAAAANNTCYPGEPIHVHIKMRGQQGDLPFDALLVGDTVNGLALTDPRTGTRLWSAGASAPATQRFADMTAGFGGSLAAVDTNADGLHDRLYAGDRAGRLWRFDLDFTAPPQSWASGGIFADLGGVPQRGFIAAPDVALMAPAGNRPWLSIALGTASTGPTPANNRFYLLRDWSPFDRWSPSQYRQWRPIRESALLRLNGQSLDPALSVSGFYLEIGASQVWARSLTLSGHIQLTIAESASLPTWSCTLTTNANPVPVSVTTIAALDGSIAGDSANRSLLPQALPPDSAVVLRDNQCVAGGLEIAGCSVDTTLHKTYWRREDAD
jgi:hypothetical protein